MKFEKIECPNCKHINELKYNELKAKYNVPIFILCKKCQKEFGFELIRDKVSHINTPNNILFT